MKFTFLVILNLWFLVPIIAQHPQIIIQDFLETHAVEQKLHPSDISNWQITDMHTSSASNATHVYIQQTHLDIPISNGLANFVLKENKVLYMNNRLINNVHQKVTQTVPTVSASQAIQLAAQYLQMDSLETLHKIKTIHSTHFIYDKGNISRKNIPVRLMYTATTDTEIKLVWDLSIYTLDAKHYWSLQIDAQQGTLVAQNDWVSHCSFAHRSSSSSSSCTNHPTNITRPSTPQGTFADLEMQSDQYTVFPLPIESPIHGSRSLVSNPADILASPYGWHDTNAIAGPEYTITRGNNVYAYEDTNNNNLPGFSPNGNSSLEFNFPYNPGTHPSTYQSAAISNLFYTNNMMHDIWYNYGFDEASGNFQNNNYGRGGSLALDGDELLAEAQDSANMNNASFMTPPDGSKPRMQLFLWNSTGSSLGNYLTINTPSNIAGNYTAAGATFGSGLPQTAIVANLVLVEDNLPPIHDACGTIMNSAALFGKIALIDLGGCNLTDKIEAVENAGAIAVVVINNTSGPPFQMLGTNTNISIPSIMISQNDGIVIKNELVNSTTINASISNNGTNNNLRDSDFDNGIIVHEYGHGISKRLTGGASNVNCLTNPEQTGEGWSDWFALVLTIEPGDQGEDSRGFGTYVSNQVSTGSGLRPAPYSTDFAVNPYTYGASNNTIQISAPHGTGFIFATVLWDLTWALIDAYGGVPDPDLYHGNGGNNIAMLLAMEALKIQPCNAGMLDGRDAILKADSILYGGAHNCLIWNVFAKRGFGYSAEQGSVFNRSDQIEAFDLPINCQVVTTAPTAAFSTNSVFSCKPTISFFDNSTDVPQFWFWDFGDGYTSTAQNPVHSYQNSGSYIIKLIVSNGMGADSTTRQVTLSNLPPTPSVDDIELCLGDTAVIATSVLGIVYWKDSAHRVIHIGDTLTVPNVGQTQTYYVENGRNVFPFTTGRSYNTGIGTYHSSPYFGALNFRASRSFEIVSAWVDADGAGPRTFYLVKGTNHDGAIPTPNSIVDQVTINLANGGQRINLDFLVPESGYYYIGGNNVDLYRHESNSNYPYVQNGYMSINSSSANNGDSLSYYYYFYDIEIRGPQCISTLDTVTITPITNLFSYTDNGGGVFNFNDLSSDANNWLWDFGDNTTSTQQNPTHTYNSSGNYTVRLSVNNGACTSTQVISVIVGLQPISQKKWGFKILPNPTEGLAQILLEKPLDEDLEVKIMHLAGKHIQSFNIPSGALELSLDLSSLPNAVYLVQIRGNELVEVRKLIVK